MFHNAIATMIERRGFIGASAFLAASPVQADLRGLEEQASGVEIDVVHTRVFAALPGGGNPCPVVKNADRLTDAQMQSLAKRWGLDTAFILRPRSADADL